MNADDAPWEPPGLALRVGDRVVVWLSSECEGMDGSGRHEIAEDASPGTVTKIWASHAVPAGHRYEVRFDVSVPCVDPPDFPIIGNVYARSELRRLAAPDPRAGDGDVRE